MAIPSSLSTPQQNPVGAKGEEILEPLVEGFKIEAKRVKEITDVVSVLAHFNSLKLSKPKDQ